MTKDAAATVDPLCSEVGHRISATPGGVRFHRYGDRAYCTRCDGFVLDLP